MHIFTAKNNVTSREASVAALHARQRPNVFMEIPETIPGEASSSSDSDSVTKQPNPRSAAADQADEGSEREPGGGATLHGLSSKLDEYVATHKQQQQQQQQAAPIWRLRLATWRYRVRVTIEDPGSSTMAYIVAVVVFLMIFSSTALFCATTVPAIAKSAEANRVIRVLEVVFISAFTAEFLLHLAVAEGSWLFFKDFRNCIDLAAILPFYIEKLFGRALDLRFLRILRVLRVFKLFKYGNKFNLVIWTLADSRDMLGMLFLSLGVLMVVFSSLVYYCEKDTCQLRLDGRCESPFRSIPHTFWWCVVTALTVGYGDMVPVTLPGKILASILMMSSLLVLALPITIVGSSFSQQWVAYQEEQAAETQVKTLHRLIQRAYPVLHAYSQELGYLNEHVRVVTSMIQVLLAEIQHDIKSGDAKEVQYGTQQVVTLAAELSKLLQLDDVLIDSKFDEQLLKVSKQLATGKQQSCQGLLLLEEVRELVATAIQWVMDASNISAAGVLPSKGHHAVLHLYLLGARRLTAKLPFRRSTSKICPYFVFKHRGCKVRTEAQVEGSDPFFNEQLTMYVGDVTQHVMLECWSAPREGTRQRRLAVGWAEIDLQVLEAEQGPQGKELQLQLNDAVSGTVHLIARVQRFDAAPGAGDFSLSQLPWNQLGALSAHVLGVRMPAALGSRQWVPASGARGGIKAGRQASVADSMRSGGSEPWRRGGQHARESGDSEGEAAAEEEEDEDEEDKEAEEESRMQSSVLAGTTRLQRCKTRKAAQERSEARQVLPSSGMATVMSYRGSVRGNKSFTSASDEGGSSCGFGALEEEEYSSYTNAACSSGRSSGEPGEPAPPTLPAFPPARLHPPTLEGRLSGGSRLKSSFSSKLGGSVGAGDMAVRFQVPALNRRSSRAAAAAALEAEEPLSRGGSRSQRQATAGLAPLHEQPQPSSSRNAHEASSAGGATGGGGSPEDDVAPWLRMHSHGLGRFPSISNLPLSEDSWNGGLDFKEQRPVVRTETGGPAAATTANCDLQRASTRGPSAGAVPGAGPASRANSSSAVDAAAALELMPRCAVVPLPHNEQHHPHVG